MIGALSQNGLLSAVFGPGVLLRPQGLDRGRIEPSSRDDAPRAEKTDTVEISDAARSLGKGGLGASPVTGVGTAQDPSGAPIGAARRASRTKPGGEETLSADEEKQVKELKERDQEVRRHEQAHKAAAGGLASGGPKFEYETGPDGRRYAVGGEVSIGTSPVAGDPQATIQKMQQVRAAALAPGEPSSQDRAVAAQARAAEQQARTELAEKGKQSPEAGKSSQPEASDSPSFSPSQGNTPTSPYQAITGFASLIDITA